MSVTHTEIELAYRLLLDRTPSAEEVEQIARHDDLASLRMTFLTSEEFAKKYARMQERLDAHQQPALVHLHIPKTAGTTLAGALSNEEALQPYMIVHDGNLDELRQLPRPRRRALRYIRGHLSMGAGEALGAPYRYLCTIRRPGPRIFSFYQFIRRSRTHPTHQLLNEQNMSFGDYLEYSLDSVPHRLEIDNGQIRRIAGRFDRTSLGQEKQLLNTALYNALSPRMIFGFVEHFDALLGSLVTEGYLSGSQVEKLNVSPDSDLYESAVEALTEDQRGIFQHYVAWDTHFYDLCEELLLPPQQ